MLFYFAHICDGIADHCLDRWETARRSQQKCVSSIVVLDDGNENDRGVQTGWRCNIGVVLQPGGVRVPVCRDNDHDNDSPPLVFLGRRPLCPLSFRRYSVLSVFCDVCPMRPIWEFRWWSRVGHHIVNFTPSLIFNTTSYCSWLILRAVKWSFHSECTHHRSYRIGMSYSMTFWLVL